MSPEVNVTDLDVSWVLAATEAVTMQQISHAAVPLSKGELLVLILKSELLNCSLN